MAILHPTASDFDSITGSGVTLVDFYADWCGPCKMLSPVIERIASDYDGKITVAKVNVDDEGELASKFGVTSIPSVVVLKDGEQKAFEIGFQPLSVYKGIIDGLI